MWNQIDVEKYAALDIAIGEKVIRVNGSWWRQVRPFFFRPIVPFEKYDPHVISSVDTKPGILQHAVVEGASHNSYLNFITYPNLDYDPHKLRKSVQHKIKKAMNYGLNIKKIDDPGRYNDKAYFIYKEFYKRTKYSYGRKRLDYEVFSNWFRKLIRETNATVFGVFIQEKIMVAFEISCIVGTTLILKEAYNSEIALKMHSSDFILDYYRRAAIQRPDIECIFDGNVCKKESVNSFKIERGANILTIKAFLHIKPFLMHTVRIINKRLYRRLIGYHET